MKERSKRRGLHQVLLDASRQLTPETLFSTAGFTPEAIEEFYEELRNEVDSGRIRELRPNDTDVSLEAVRDET